MAVRQRKFPLAQAAIRRRSRNGNEIAWRSQQRGGFEADKWRLIVQDRQLGLTRNLTENFDRSVGTFTWLDSNSILFSAEDHGESSIYVAFAAGPERGRVLQIEQKIPIHADDLVWIRDTLFFSRMSIAA